MSLPTLGFQLERDLLLLGGGLASELNFQVGVNGRRCGG
jgi:hypothetical protein